MQYFVRINSWSLPKNRLQVAVLSILANHFHNTIIEDPKELLKQVRATVDEYNKLNPRCHPLLVKDSWDYEDFPHPNYSTEERKKKTLIFIDGVMQVSISEIRTVNQIQP